MTVGYLSTLVSLMGKGRFMVMAAWRNGIASDYESGDCRFDPCGGHVFTAVVEFLALICPPRRLILAVLNTTLRRQGLTWRTIINSITMLVYVKRCYFTFDLEKCVD